MIPNSCLRWSPHFLPTIIQSWYYHSLLNAIIRLRYEHKEVSSAPIILHFSIPGDRIACAAVYVFSTFSATWIYILFKSLGYSRGQEIVVTHTRRASTCFCPSKLPRWQRHLFRLPYPRPLSLWLEEPVSEQLSKGKF